MQPRRPPEPTRPSPIGSSRSPTEPGNAAAWRPAQRAHPGCGADAAGPAAQRAADLGRRGSAGSRRRTDRHQPARRARRGTWTESSGAARSRCGPRWRCSPATQPRSSTAAPTCSMPPRPSMASTLELEQTALIRAFEYCLPTERLTRGVTLAELGRRLRDGADVAEGRAATILRGLSAHILLPYAQAVPIMRAAVDVLLALDDSDELLQVGTVSVALTTALWDERAASRLPAAGRRRRPRRGVASAAGHRVVDHVARRARRRHAPTGRACTSSRYASSDGRSATRPNRWSTPPTWHGSGAPRAQIEALADAIGPPVGAVCSHRPSPHSLPATWPRATIATLTTVSSRWSTIRSCRPPRCSIRTSSRPRSGPATTTKPSRLSRSSPRWQRRTDRPGRGAWPPARAR